MERDRTRAPRQPRREFTRLLAPCRRDDAVTVLGAGADDLAPGRGFLAALAPGGWAVPTWPSDCGGRGASAEDAAVIGEGAGVLRLTRPLSVPRRAARDRADARGAGDAGAAAPLAPGHRGRDRHLVPAVLGAGRRLGPRQRRAPGPSATGTAGGSPARRCGAAGRRTRREFPAARAPIRVLPSARGLVLCLFLGSVACCCVLGNTRLGPRAGSPARVRRPAAPHLLSGDPPAVPVALGPGVDVGEVRAGTRLRKQLAPDVGPGRDGREPAVPLRRRRQRHERRPDHVQPDEERIEVGLGAARQLPHRSPRRLSASPRARRSPRATSPRPSHPAPTRRGSHDPARGRRRRRRAPSPRRPAARRQQPCELAGALAGGVSRSIRESYEADASRFAGRGGGGPPLPPRRS